MINPFRITFSGVDDTITPEALASFQVDYPEIDLEWGVLLSKKRAGTARYPSLDWLEKVARYTIFFKDKFKLNLAGHLQGQWLQEVINGEFMFPSLWKKLFRRMQLNFHGQTLNDNFPNNLKLRPLNWDMDCNIFQVVNGDDRLVHKARKLGINVYPLYDSSCGNGKVPDFWIKGYFDVNGFAGGLGPDNIKEEWFKIVDAADGKDFWIDCETQ